MDCSGLLINSFTVIDVALPRSSADQSKVGKEVKNERPRAGRSGVLCHGQAKEKVTHVGLVTDVRSKGDAKLIHASSSLGVVETNIYAEYYQKRFRGARRVIEAK